MKKVFSLLLVLLLVVFLVGCGKKNNEQKNDEPVKLLADDEVEVNGVLYKLNKDESVYGINFKIAENFKKVNNGNAFSYFGKKDEESNSGNFVIRVFHYKNKTLEESIKFTADSYDSKEDVTIGDKNYTKVHFVNYNGLNTYLFFYKYKKKEFYVYCFTAEKEEERLENIFLTNVIYKKSK